METTTTDGELFIKGAPEVVIGMCDTFNKISKDDAFSVLKEYQAKGMRTLAFAYKKEGGITLQAIVAISDPVRSDVAEAINICRSHAHVRVIMVTGDNAITAGDTQREAAIQTCYDRQQEEEFRRFCEMSWITGMDVNKSYCREIRLSLDGISYQYKQNDTYNDIDTEFLTSELVDVLESIIGYMYDQYMWCRYSVVPILPQLLSMRYDIEDKTINALYSQYIAMLQNSMSNSQIQVVMEIPLSVRV